MELRRSTTTVRCPQRSQPPPTCLGRVKLPANSSIPFPDSLVFPLSWRLTHFSSKDSRLSAFGWMSIHPSLLDSVRGGSEERSSIYRFGDHLRFSDIALAVPPGLALQ